MFTPLKFQKNTLEKLLNEFLHLWGQTESKRYLVFKSPTGSGKTFAVCNLINGLNSLPNWDYDKCFIWITFSDELAMQSKDKFQSYFNTTLQNNLITVNDFNQGRLHKNDVLFINWQKLVSRKAKDRVLRRPEEEELRKEKGYYFEDFIENTQSEGREIVLVIDESHKNRSTDLAQEVIDIINPKIILNVSATPKYVPSMDDIEDGKAAYVRVKRTVVIEEGLIKEQVLTQTKEDLASNQGKDQDELLLDLAIEKRKELKAEFKALGKDVNPLVLVQLPNDDKKLIDQGQETKEQIVTKYLKKQSIDTDKDVAYWFDSRKENMEFISENDCDINFMLFKQAAGTGWDCPRAHILVMYREITSPTFHTQTIGRILRMPEPNLADDYKLNPNLRTGFLYTNYDRNEVKIPEQNEGNKPLVFISRRIEPFTDIIDLDSEFVSRLDYGDLGNAASFQLAFVNSLNKYFSITQSDISDIAKVKITEKGVDVNPTITNTIIVDAAFSDFDKLNFGFSKEGGDVNLKMSNNDIEKLFNYWCYNILTEQEDDESKVSNIARSWSPLKSAFRVWSKPIFNNYLQSYSVFIADINKNESSKFREAILQALKDYYPVRHKYLVAKKKKTQAKSTVAFNIQSQYGFNEDYAMLDNSEGSSALSVVQPFYIKKEYNGRINELAFVQYLESKSNHIEWWFKNGDSGKEAYCLRYYNTAKKEDALFYPDWLVKFKDGRFGIFDTKGGNTAINPEGRELGLADKIKSLNESGGNFVGGLVVLENNLWHYFNNSDYMSNNSSELNYEYTKGRMGDNWLKFESLFSI